MEFNNAFCESPAKSALNTTSADTPLSNLLQKALKRNTPNTNGSASKRTKTIRNNVSM